jgi:peptidoglycan glycosyltransferase
LWITAFAPADAPKYAVVVMLKGTNEEISAGTGGRVAGPIAKAMLDAVFAADAAALLPPTTDSTPGSTPDATAVPSVGPTEVPATGPPTSDGAG